MPAPFDGSALLHYRLGLAGLAISTYHVGHEGNSGRSLEDKLGIRAAGLEAGLVDVKVVRVDNDWSGMKFGFRINDRK